VIRPKLWKISEGTEMIAHFWYAEEPAATHVTVRLAWHDGQPSGRVEAPAFVAWERPELDIPLGGPDDFMSLGYALGYGVLIATTAGTKLTLTGDVTAWPQEWGVLTARPSVNLDLPTG
jgi:hypothetical protein